MSPQSPSPAILSIRVISGSSLTSPAHARRMAPANAPASATASALLLPVLLHAAIDLRFLPVPTRALPSARPAW